MSQTFAPLDDYWKCCLYLNTTFNTTLTLCVHETWDKSQKHFKIKKIYINNTVIVQLSGLDKSLKNVPCLN